MKTVSVYDIRELVETDPTNKLNLTTHMEHEVAILVGPKGVVVTGTEGVFWTYDSPEEKHTIHLNEGKRVEVDKDGKERTLIPIIATHETQVPVQGIIDEATERREVLGNFIRRFGGRLESNYRELLKAIKEIGLDPADYPRGERKERKSA